MMRRYFLLLILFSLVLLGGCTSEVYNYETDDFTITRPAGWFFEDNAEKLPEGTVLLVLNRNIENNNYSSINIAVDDLSEKIDITADDFYNQSVELVANTVGYSLIDTENFDLSGEKGLKHTFEIKAGEEIRKFNQYYLLDAENKKGYVLTSAMSISADDQTELDMENIIKSFTLKSTEN